MLNFVVDACCSESRRRSSFFSAVFGMLVSALRRFDVTASIKWLLRIRRVDPSSGVTELEKLEISWIAKLTCLRECPLAL